MPFSDYSLNQWLSYFENRSQQEIQLGLVRIKTVAERLQLLPIHVPVITVGGTNGKGSTVASLETIYAEAGYQVGVYTSPHLLCFNERIRCNQHNITDDALCHAFLVIEAARNEIHLTYFEMATLAALFYFKTQQPDVIILEVGMGGRLDATNIVDADVAIITTVDFDHEDYLGNTLDAIGYEKAGILKPHQQFIYADLNMPQSIQHCAEELNIHPICLQQDYDFTLNDHDLIMTVHSEKKLVLPRPNIHPHAAAAAIVASFGLEKKLPVTVQALNRAMQNVFLAGRNQIIYDTICTVLDVSHNPQSVSLLAERMKKLINERVKGKVYAVFSGLKDKDLCGLIDPMRSYVDEWFSAVLDHQRAASECMLQDAFKKTIGLQPIFTPTIVEAYKKAHQLAEPGDVIVVYGSFLVVSPVILEEGFV